MMDTKTYSVDGKSYEVMGEILWTDLKPGDCYIGANKEKPYKCLTKALPYYPSKRSMKVSSCGKEFWIFRKNNFQVSLLAEVNTIKQNKGETKMADQQQLFKIKGTEHFGNVIATDSQGNKIFEIRGGGGIQVVKPDQIEEVFPFTFSVVFVGNNNNGGTHYHFYGEEGKFEVGEILIYDNGMNNIGICKVTGVDTKSRSATKTFSGYRLNAQKI